MPELQPITLHFLRGDGRRETTKLSHHTLGEARLLAKSILRRVPGLYTAVEIEIDANHFDTVRGMNLTLADFERV